MGYKTEGTCYQATKQLDIKDIAKLMRKDIKKQFPGIKASVTIRRYSMGRSIDINIKGVPNGLIVNNPDFKPEVFSPVPIPRYTPEAKKLLADIETIHKKYNFDDSDIQSDYFSVKYYGQVTYDWKIFKGGD